MSGQAMPPCGACRHFQREVVCSAPNMWPDFSCFQKRPAALRYRVALCRDGTGAMFLDFMQTKQGAEACENGRSFIRWAGPWQEVDTSPETVRSIISEQSKEAW